MVSVHSPKAVLGGKSGGRADSTATQLDRAVNELLEQGRFVLVIDASNERAGRTGSRKRERFVHIGSPGAVRAFPSRRLGLVRQPNVSDTVFRRVWAEIQLHNMLAEIHFVDLSSGSPSETGGAEEPRS
jgi:hypothetical protein